VYVATDLLSSVDSNPILFIALGALAMVFNYTFFAEAIRAARRDRVFAFPLMVSTLWFAHDLSFVLRGFDWFGTYHHWYVELFFVALIPTTLFELFFIRQVWTYGQAEIMPGASRRQFALFILGAEVAGLIIWFATKEVLGDPIYAFTFGGVAALAPIMAIRRIIQRGDSKGQSPLLWLSFSAMLICWYTAVWLFFGPAFKTAPQVLLALLAIGGGLVMARLSSRGGALKLGA